MQKFWMKETPGLFLRLQFWQKFHSKKLDPSFKLKRFLAKEKQTHPEKSDDLETEPCCNFQINIGQTQLSINPTFRIYKSSVRLGNQIFAVVIWTMCELFSDVLSSFQTLCIYRNTMLVGVKRSLSMYLLPSRTITLSCSLSFSCIVKER